ncbi:MAG TPA: tripartite tricarboxylate transporter substrate binding protein [Xanthobacteraceae bacterium]
MKIPRRKFLYLCASAAAAAGFPGIAAALDYPARPVRIVVGFAAGVPTDIGARLMAQWLSERLGQPFIVENRPGAGSNLATETVARAAPDGYTLLLAGSANTVNPALYANLNVNFIRDIAPVAGLMQWPNLMEVNPSFPAKTVPDFIAYAKANPGKVNMASGGNGTSNHVSGELFKMMAGVALQHVPYRSGGAALTALLGGQVQVTFESTLSSLEYIRSGKLRALAVTTPTRLEALPDIPAVGEFVPGYAARGWTGIGVPKNTPAEIIEKLNTVINAVLVDPNTKARLATFGGAALPGSPTDFATMIAEETEKWAKVIKFAGIKAE